MSEETQVQATEPQGTDENVTVDPGVADTQPVENAGSEGDGGEGKISDSERLRELVQRGKDDPDIEYSDEDLEFLEKHEFGENPPKEEVNKAPEKNEKTEKLMKEVGAKSEDEILGKVQELRKQLSSRDSQAYGKLKNDFDGLQKKVENESALWQDLKTGNQGAVDYIQKNLEHLGLKIVPVNGQQQQNQGGQEQKAYIPKDKFIDEESADLVNTAFSAIEQKLMASEKKVETLLSRLDQEDQRRNQESAKEKSITQQIDEMVLVSAAMPELKAIPNLREAIRDWHVTGKEDTRLDVFKELFETANQYHTNLEGAFKIRKADQAELSIAKAKEDGRKEAYSHKPNKSLSGRTSGEGETYQHFTDADIEEMMDDPYKIPAEWLDDKESPNSKTIPKRFHKYFFEKGVVT
jgi:hypothetical protein